MSEGTKIEWCDHTFNPWWGCARVSAGCANCYAETFAHRFHVGWGNAPRRIASEDLWAEPVRWNLRAKRLGKRARVFCASMADVFEERPELVEPRRRLYALIRETPWLDWLLLTKRPENFAARLPLDWGMGYPNVWLGVSVEDQGTADRRIPALLAMPARVRFVSAEPLLGPVDFTRMDRTSESDPGYNALSCGPDDEGDLKTIIDWVIVGGESGPKARAFSLVWAHSIVNQCRDAGVACFVKQLGSRPYWENPDARSEYDEGAGPYELADRKGGDPKEWPIGLRVRQFPKVLA